MKEPKKIPLTDSPRIKEPKRIPLSSHAEYITDDVWERVDNQHAPPVFVKSNNEDNRKNNTQIFPELDSK